MSAPIVLGRRRELVCIIAVAGTELLSSGDGVVTDCLQSFYDIGARRELVSSAAVIVSRSGD